jgi:HAMP domain-containing protein
MTRIIQDLRIGTKLAITSALSILLVASMIYLQMTGGADVRRANDSAVRQQSIAQNAAEAKASVRGMQIGVRDILLSATPADLQKATSYFADRETAALKFAGEMAKLSKSVENGERITKLASLIGDLRRGKEQIEAVRKEAIGIETKRGAGQLSAEATVQLSKLADEVARIRKDVTAPINAELEATANKITDHGKQRSEEARIAAADEAASVERTSLIVGIIVAVLLIGTCVFSIFTIARPMRALSAAMDELANGNFGVILPGLGRKDEVGDVAGAVEKFKVVAEQRRATKRKPRSSRIRSQPSSAGRT